MDAIDVAERALPRPSARAPGARQRSVPPRGPGSLSAASHRTVCWRERGVRCLRLQPVLGKLVKVFLVWVSFFFCLRWPRGRGPRVATSSPCRPWEVWLARGAFLPSSPALRAPSAPGRGRVCVLIWPGCHQNGWSFHVVHRLAGPCSGSVWPVGQGRHPRGPVAVRCLLTGMPFRDPLFPLSSVA